MQHFTVLLFWTWSWGVGERVEVVEEDECGVAILYLLLTTSHIAHAYVSVIFSSLQQDNDVKCKFNRQADPDHISFSFTKNVLLPRMLFVVLPSLHHRLQYLTSIILVPK